MDSYLGNFIHLYNCANNLTDKTNFQRKTIIPSNREIGDTFFVFLEKSNKISHLI